MNIGILNIEKLQPEQKHAECIQVECEGKKYNIKLSKQKTGFGIRSFLVCPVCGKSRVELVYTVGGFGCYDCKGINKYKGIQNSTKGGYIELGYRMERYAKKNGIKFKFPFDFIQLALDKRISDEDFRKKIKVLQALENMRLQNILFGIIYSPETIRSVVKGNHPALDDTLENLRVYLHKF